MDIKYTQVKSDYADYVIVIILRIESNQLFIVSAKSTI